MKLSFPFSSYLSKIVRRHPGASALMLAKPEHRWYRHDFHRDGFLQLPRFVEGRVCDRITEEASAFYGRRGVAAGSAMEGAGTLPLVRSQGEARGLAGAGGAPRGAVGTPDVQERDEGA